MASKITLHSTYQDFQRAARHGNVIPVSYELSADLETPVSVFLKVATHKANALLLESVELGEQLGRYSLIGIDSHTTIDYRSNRLEIEREGKRSIQAKPKPLLEIIQDEIKRFKFVSDPSLPPLVGSFVGYLSYELVQQFEDVRFRRKKGLNLPDSVLFLPQNLIAFDHIKHRLILIHLAMVDHSTRAAYDTALRALKHLKQQIDRETSLPELDSNTTAKSRPVRSNVTKGTFEKMVRKAKAYIRAGECIQVVLSQRFDLGAVANEFNVYRALRSLNPSPYMFYLKHRDLALVGSSPEVLVKKTGSIAELRPIAGTRPRGKTNAEDLAYEKALLASPKERAEHVMLVDLGRNDLGRVCETRSVKVEDFSRVERYSHVMHLVSDVRARMKKGKNAFDLLKAAFPAGTVSGAPKIRAMQIIDELEPETRGPYAGSVGYFGIRGDMDMCITIRTIVVKRGRAYVQAGAGIVNDSLPANEYRETLNKASALVQATEKSRTLSSNSRRTR